jgi:prepilin-type N-terminal cleavage/methylation domain-containing protein/prepilin-type processing-associated H-X9-DG protein
MRRSHRTGFTLVEMLVVVAILATLLALLMPTLADAAFAARLAACKSNLRQITVAHTNYASEERGWYPYPATEQRQIEGETRWMLPTGTSPSQSSMLAPYLDGSNSMNPLNNPVLECAQGAKDIGEESEKNNRQYYAFYANRLNAQGGNQGPYYDRDGDGNWQRTWQYAKDESKLLRKVNDEMYFNGYRNNWGWSTTNGYYSILASDWITRIWATSAAYNNHVRGGTGYLDNRKRIKWESGQGIANYAMVDGSVVDFTYPADNFRDTMSMGHITEGGAQTIVFPKDWARDPEVR